MSKAVIVDMVMGSGKTTMAIEGIKENDMKFIFVTEYLKEIERMITTTGKLVTPEPKFGEGSKRNHLLKLLAENKNVAISHSLFKSLRLEDYSLFNGYKLIIDEVVSVVEKIDISSDDINDLREQKRLIINTEDNTVTWNDGKDYLGNWNGLRDKILSGGVEIVNDSYLVWTFPVEVFNNVSEIIVLTYLFEGSVLCAYFKYHNISYSFIPDLIHNSDTTRKKIVKLLNVYGGQSNKIGNSSRKSKKRPLTSSWYKNKNNKPKIKKFATTVNGWFKNHAKGSKNNKGVSVFKDYEELFTERAIFIPINKRASNEYRNITAIAYIIDFNINPVLEHYFNQRNIKLNKDLYSLSGMIQLLWRGCIRDDKPMDVFIPSLRMRNLLYQWLKIE